jgi:N-acetylneuraminic acid mutarotase
MACSRSVVESLEVRALLHGGLEAFINFQPASAPVPAGYFADTGAVFGDRGNGLAYGWDVGNTAFARDRNSSLSADQRYDTLNHMKRIGGGKTWEIAVPDGDYEVRLVAGDATALDSIYAINVEGALALSGKPSASTRWFEGTRTVAVSDGRLTISSAPGSFNNKLCFIEIHQIVPAEAPVVGVAAGDPSASEAGRDRGTFVISRGDEPVQDLTINYVVFGNATSGEDYAPIGRSVVIPRGSASVEVSVEPVDDALAEGGETVVLTLAPSPAGVYEVDPDAASATVTIADNDSTGTGFAAHVNFQPAASPVPAGYVADAGAVYGDRGNGLSYGWDLSTATFARDRNLVPDQRWDTNTSMQRAGGGSVWEIAVPNGNYTVHLVAGDALAYDSTYAINAEGSLVVSGKPTSTVKWYEGTKTITVSDGRLTLTNAAGSANNKVCFIDIVGLGANPSLPEVSVSASDAAASESGGNPGAFTVTRTGPTNAPLAVKLTVGGNATNGADYALLGTTVTIPAGAASATLAVLPVDDSAVEGNESVTLSIAPSAAYTAAAGSAAVSIADNDAPAGTLSWREVAPATVGRSEGMGAVVNGKLYLFGGYIDTTFKPTSRGDVYDPATDSWRQIASLPFGISHMGTVAVGNSIYFAGGYPATATNQTFSTTAVWRYDTVTNTFSDLPPLPAARGGGALAALGRVLHFFGGSDAARKDAAQHWQLDLDDLAAGWVARAPLPVATNHVAGVVLDGRVHAIGGQQNQDSAAIQRAEVQVYDPATNAWTSLAPLPLARSHITGSTFVRSGRILVLGGIGPGNSVIRRVDSYNPVTNTWTPLTSLPAGRLSGVSDALPDGRIIFSTGSMVKTTWVGTFA